MARARQRSKTKTAPVAKQPNGIGGFAVQRVERVVPIDHVKPNRWNYNRQDDFIFEREKKSIQTFGFIVPPLVRSGNEDGDFGYYEIIDGEHRWRACGELGFTEIPVNDLGCVPDRDAKKLCVILNETKGEPEYEKLGSLLASLADDGVDDLLAEMPFPEAELRALISLPANPLDDMGSGGSATPPAEPDPEKFETLELKVNTEQRTIIEAAVAAALGSDVLRAPKDVKLALGLERVCRTYLGAENNDEPIAEDDAPDHAPPKRRRKPRAGKTATKKKSTTRRRKSP